MRLALVLTAASALWAQPVPDCKLVPAWQQQGEARSFTSENLFEYMNGNAEGYIIYAFQKMNGVTCKQGDDTIIFDISEMADPDSAYGIFTANRDPKREDLKIGMAGQIQPRRATFVKGNYYVEIAAEPEKDHTATLKAFVAAFEPKVPGRTTLPDALSWFPEEKRSALRLVPESVLGLRLLRRGYAAQYENGAKAFLVKETSPDAAKGVLEKLKARFGETRPAKVGDEGFQVAEKYLGRLCFFRKGQYLGGWANVPEGQDPNALAGALAGHIQ